MKENTFLFHFLMFTRVKGLMYMALSKAPDVTIEMILTLKLRA